MFTIIIKIVYRKNLKMAQKFSFRTKMVHKPGGDEFVYHNSLKMVHKFSFRTKMVHKLRWNKFVYHNLLKMVHKCSFRTKMIHETLARRVPSIGSLRRFFTPLRFVPGLLRSYHGLVSLG
jgi:hypothetical protein